MPGHRHVADREHAEHDRDHDVGHRNPEHAGDRIAGGGPAGRGGERGGRGDHEEHHARHTEPVGREHPGHLARYDGHPDLLPGANVRSASSAQRRPMTASPTAASVWSTSSRSARGSWSRSWPSRRRIPVRCSCHQVNFGSSPHASARLANVTAGTELPTACSWVSRLCTAASGPSAWLMFTARYLFATPPHHRLPGTSSRIPVKHNRLRTWVTAL